MLPGLGDQPLAVRSTTRDPFSVAAFAIFPRFEAHKNRPPIAVHGGRDRDAARERGGVAQPNTELFVKFSEDGTNYCLFLKFCEWRDVGGDGSVKSAGHEIPDPGIPGPGRKREGSSRRVHSPPPSRRIQNQPPEHLPRVGQTAVVPGPGGEDPAV